MTESAIVGAAITEWLPSGEATPLLIDRLADAAVRALREAKLTPGELDAIICNT